MKKYKMNIEEAIKLLKQEPDFSLSYYKREYAIDVLLADYEKQQKEIEDIKRNITEEGFFNIGFDEAVKCIRDKIKEKIERLEVSGSLEDDIGVLYLKQLLKYIEEFLRGINK